ncbi:MAG: hypothetical protein J2P36_06285 [Ktedonobacteraceae bacterium]|nr:hypothetical protein [Ktedonobacteraceae bacterium]
METRVPLMPSVPVSPQERSRADQQGMRAGCSPGAVWLWRCRSIGTARARDTDCKRGYGKDGFPGQPYEPLNL